MGRLAQTVPKVRLSSDGGAGAGGSDAGHACRMPHLGMNMEVCRAAQRTMPAPLDGACLAPHLRCQCSPSCPHLPFLPSHSCQVLNVGLLVSALFHILELGSLLVDGGIAVRRQPPWQGTRL